MPRPFLPGVSFVRGANLPWLSYGNDFGRSGWHPNGGVIASMQATLESTFEQLAAAGAAVVRWFVLCDGRAGIVHDGDGNVVELDDRTLDDFELAIRVAEACGVPLLPVLFDFHWCRPPRIVNGVRCAGRADQLADTGRRNRLLQVLRPMLARFGHRHGIAGWDIINEPEWVTFSWQSWNPRRAILPDVMTDFIADAAALVHASTDHPVTTGLASSVSLPRVRHLGLDFYQVHWYDGLDRLAPLETPVATWHLDRPVLLGEFPTRGSKRSPREIEALGRAAGYSGALGWSVRADDEATDATALWTWLGEDARRGRLIAGTASSATADLE